MLRSRALKFTRTLYARASGSKVMTSPAPALEDHPSRRVVATGTPPESAGAVAPISSVKRCEHVYNINVRAGVDMDL